jgi:hydroxymethylpyrimidine/phosphomethylpyrimidine kinase
LEILDKTHPKALTVAGSDSGGGAGIQADLKTFAALGVYGCSVITAVTAQNTAQVLAIELVSPQSVRKQLEAVLADIGPEAIKIGMLGSAANAQVIADVLRDRGDVPLVLDPVMAAKTGDSLLPESAVRVLRESLLPLAELITPNIPETEALTGMRLKCEADFESAARLLSDMGARAVLVKGGHHSPVLASDGTQEVVDILYAGGSFHRISGPYIDTRHTHGTGCTLSAAITAGLSRNMDILSAVSAAREYLSQALRAAFPVGHGISPVHHFHAFWKTL